MSKKHDFFYFKLSGVFCILFISYVYKIWLKGPKVDFITKINLFSKLLLKKTTSEYFVTKINYVFLHQPPPPLNGYENIKILLFEIILKHIVKMCTISVIINCKKMFLNFTRGWRNVLSQNIITKLPKL